MPLTPLGILRSQWRWAVMLVMTAVVIGLWAFAGHLRQAAKGQKTKTVQAVHQAEVQVVATKAADAVTQTIIRTEERTRVITQTIHDAPGADDAIPAAVLSAWRRGLSDDEPAQD